VAACTASPTARHPLAACTALPTAWQLLAAGTALFESWVTWVPLPSPLRICLGQLRARGSRPLPALACRSPTCLAVLLSEALHTDACVHSRMREDQSRADYPQPGGHASGQSFRGVRVPLVCWWAQKRGLLGPCLERRKQRATLASNCAAPWTRASVPPCTNACLASQHLSAKCLCRHLSSRQAGMALHDHRHMRCCAWHCMTIGWHGMA